MVSPTRQTYINHCPASIFSLLFYDSIEKNQRLYNRFLSIDLAELWEPIRIIPFPAFGYATLFQKAWEDNLMEKQPWDSKGIAEKFKVHRNPEFAVPMAAYMRNQFAFLGIKTPLRKALISQQFHEFRLSER